MVETLYDDLPDEDLVSTVILTPTNEYSLIINGHALETLPGQPISYFSADDVECDDELERSQYPVEFLNSITPSGMPPRCLKFKIGAIVMLLRNFDLKKCLCNGTRLVIMNLHHNVIDWCFYRRQGFDTPHPISLTCMPFTYAVVNSLYDWPIP